MIVQKNQIILRHILIRHIHVIGFLSITNIMSVVYLYSNVYAIKLSASYSLNIFNLLLKYINKTFPIYYALNMSVNTTINISNIYKYFEKHLFVPNKLLSFMRCTDRL